jgi:hypothetical protein
MFTGRFGFAEMTNDDLVQKRLMNRTVLLSGLGLNVVKSEPKPERREEVLNNSRGGDLRGGYGGGKSRVEENRGGGNRGGY